MTPVGNRWICWLMPILACQAGCLNVHPKTPRAEVARPQVAVQSTTAQNNRQPSSPYALVTESVASVRSSLSAIPFDDPHLTPAVLGLPRPAEAKPEMVPIQPRVIQVPAKVAPEFTAETLVAEVQARNPTIAQMTASAQAAFARYPQVISLDDPMLGGALGPASIGSRSVDVAYRVEISQRLPFLGKRFLRGENALAEAHAASSDLDDTRLQLAEVTRAAFYDYFLAERALEVNREGLELLEEFKKDAQARYKTGLVPEQDVLLAEVEIGRQRERQLSFDRAREIAVARINTLRHMPAQTPLPPSPRELKTSIIPLDADRLRGLAISQRPDLRAVAHRLAAERASLALAEREYQPDFEAVAAYDHFWQSAERDVRPMIGLRMNLPVRTARRDGAVAEAAAKLAQRRAEYDRLTDQANYEVQQAVAQLRESDKAAQLYRESILPAAKENVRAARAAYVAAKIPALSLIEAQRNLIAQRERAFEVTADFFRREALLERAIGGSIPLTGHD